MDYNPARSSESWMLPPKHLHAGGKQTWLKTFEMKDKNSFSLGKLYIYIVLRADIPAVLLHLPRHMNTLFNRYTPVMAPLIHPQSLSLHHLCCWRTGLAMWQADGMALHQASLCSTPPKLKENGEKQKGIQLRLHSARHCYQKTNEAPQAFFTSQL